MFELVRAQQNHCRLENGAGFFHSSPACSQGCRINSSCSIISAIPRFFSPVLHPQGQGELCCHRDEGKVRQEAKVKHIPGEFMAQFQLWNSLVKFLGVLQQCPNTGFNVDSEFPHFLACARYHGA